MTKISTTLLLTTNVISGLLVGVNVGSLSPAIGSMTETLNIAHSTWLQAFITSAFLLGGMIGSICGGIIADRFGRVTGLMMTGMIVMCGTLCQSFSYFGEDSAPLLNYYFILFFRLVLGFGVGLACVISPLYCNENARAEKSGRITVSFQLSICVGIFTAYLVGLISVVAIGEENLGERFIQQLLWRVYMGIGCIPGMVLLCVSVFILPESPIWVAKQVSGSNQVEASGSYYLLITKHIRSFVLGIVLASLLQLTGINVIIFLGVSLLKEILGFDSEILTQLINVGLGFWNSVTVLVAIVFIEKLGRKFLILFGGMLVTISIIGVGVILKVAEYVEIDPRLFTFLVLVLLATYILGFEAGPGALFWVYANEIYPTEVKEQGASSINLLQWTFQLVTTTSFLPLSEAIGTSVVFWIYGGIGIFVFIYLIIELKDTYHTVVIINTKAVAQ